MTETKLTKEEVLKKRPDLIEAERKEFASFIADGTLPLCWNFNFPIALNAVAKGIPLLDPILDGKIKRAIEEYRFKIELFADEVFSKSNEAHEISFPFYKTLHEKYRVPYSDIAKSQIKP